MSCSFAPSARNEKKKDGRAMATGVERATYRISSASKLFFCSQTNPIRAMFARFWFLNFVSCPHRPRDGKEFKLRMQHSVANYYFQMRKRQKNRYETLLLAMSLSTGQRTPTDRSITNDADKGIRTQTDSSGEMRIFLPPCEKKIIKNKSSEKKTKLGPRSAMAADISTRDRWKS